MSKTFFLDLEPPLLEEYIVKNGFSRYRASQITKWVYKKRVRSFTDCSDLPLDLQKNLEERFLLRSFRKKDKKASKLDSSVKYAFESYDGFVVNTVFLPQKDRNSVCLSAQIGCPIGCSFCASGRVKFRRNLTRGEILEQVIRIEEDRGIKLDSILFMGMGEPLLNYQNVVSSIKSFADENQFGYSRRHIIISTVGIVPQIRKLAEEKIGVRLALSLHSPDDNIREKIVPEEVPYSVKEILKAGINCSRDTKSRLTIEYVLIPGINDNLASARKLLKLIQRGTVYKDQIQVNLIPYNPTGLKDTKTPAKENVQEFKDYLLRHKLLTIVREPRGTDIGAACGQLTLE